MELMESAEFIELSVELSCCGLVWDPEIGDEVSERPDLEGVAILVNPQGLSIRDLREQYLWLPTVEQLVMQIEARGALLCHIGVGQDLRYESVIKTDGGIIEASASTLRNSLALAMQSLLRGVPTGVLH